MIWGHIFFTLQEFVLMEGDKTLALLPLLKISRSTLSGSHWGICLPQTLLATKGDYLGRSA